MPKIITFSHKGDFQKTDRLFHRIIERHYMHKLAKYGEKGVMALSAATPNDSGKTAEAWSYEISEGDGSLSVYWKNSNVNDGVNIAIILQYGHGTRNGGYVEGRDYINPAIQPVFDAMADEAWKEVVSG
jgi:hypothetical protein